ncbi:MAG: hypothetical protein OEM02_12570 [Desulfobulbaceae bacterium]|nr:hypothetical protein [Desulfobulbaceae bacterium]
MKKGKGKKDIVLNRMLNNTIEEAKKSLENIGFFLNNCGVSLDKGLQYDFDGLIIVEKYYRQLCKVRGFKDIFTKETYEELMTYFLGEVLIRNYNGEWSIYSGKYYVLKPVVIKLGTGKSIDINVFCDDLISNKGAKGSGENKSLYLYAKHAEKNACL